MTQNKLLKGGVMLLFWVFLILLVFFGGRRIVQGTFYKPSLLCAVSTAILAAIRCAYFKAPIRAVALGIFSANSILLFLHYAESNHPGAAVGFLLLPMPLMLLGAFIWDLVFWFRNKA